MQSRLPRIRLAERRHGHGGQHTGGLAKLLNREFEGQGVHDRRKHADGIGTRAFYALLGALDAAKEIAAADDDRHFDAKRGRFDEIQGKAFERLGIEAMGTLSHKRLARQFHDDSAPLPRGLRRSASFSHPSPFEKECDSPLGSIACFPRSLLSYTFVNASNLMDESVKTLVAEAFPDLAQELFGHAFNLDDACGLVGAYMFRRYGVSNYLCSKDVKTVLTSQLDAEPKLQRATEGGETPAWKPR